MFSWVGIPSCHSPSFSIYTPVSLNASLKVSRPFHTPPKQFVQQHPNKGIYKISVYSVNHLKDGWISSLSKNAYFPPFYLSRGHIFQDG